MTMKFSVQQKAAWVHRRLVDFVRRLDLNVASPGDLTRILGKGHYAQESAECFVSMARKAVRRKYVQAGLSDVVAAMDHIDAPGVSRMLFPELVRVAIRATRLRCADNDLFVYTRTISGLTPWVFQQPDLRYRAGPEALTRLRFMVSCWEHYAAQADLSQSMEFGLSAFPFSAMLHEVDRGQPSLPGLALKAKCEPRRH